MTTTPREGPVPGARRSTRCGRGLARLRDDPASALHRVASELRRVGRGGCAGDATPTGSRRRSARSSSRSGISAHALDELHGRPFADAPRPPDADRARRRGAAGALAIGIAGAMVVSPLLIPLVVAGAVLVPGYNLELAGGRFHSDLWFALAWGGFPAFTGYFVNALAIRPAGLLVTCGVRARERRATPAQHARPSAPARDRRGDRRAAAGRWRVVRLDRRGSRPRWRGRFRYCGWGWCCWRPGWSRCACKGKCARPTRASPGATRVAFVPRGRECCAARGRVRRASCSLPRARDRACRAGWPVYRSRKRIPSCASGSTARRSTSGRPAGAALSGARGRTQPGDPDRAARRECGRAPRRARGRPERRRRARDRDAPPVSGSRARATRARPAVGRGRPVQRPRLRPVQRPERQRRWPPGCRLRTARSGSTSAERTWGARSRTCRRRGSARSRQPAGI